MDNLDKFQSIFVKIDKFGWWDLERISADAGVKFTSTDSKEECLTCEVHLTLAATEHQEMNGQIKVTRRTLCTMSFYLMVPARFLEAYIHLALIYTTYHIFLFLTINDMIKKEGDPTTPFKLATGTKHSLSYLSVLFCLCVARKATSQVDKKALNIFHQAQKYFWVSLL